jgi:uncharacterized membrane protein YgdD (TMEM256/DUF423 family)
MDSFFSEAPARTFLRIGSLLGFLDVAFGAFGAHALRERLSQDLLAVFETGVRYQMYHALAVLIVAVVLSRSVNARAVWAGWCFVAGIVLFSGSLYVLALTGIGILGAVTPLGGLFFLAGWIFLMLSGVKK